MVTASIRGPPLTGRRIVTLRAGDVKSSYEAHPRGEPEETLGAKHARKRALDQIPKLPRVEGPPGAIHEGRHALVAPSGTWLVFHQFPPSSAGECSLEVKRNSSVQQLRRYRLVGSQENASPRVEG